MSLLRAALAAALLLGLSAPAFAETATALAPPPAVTHGKITVRGQVIAYRGEAAEDVMRNAAGEPRATIFAVSYIAEHARPAARPVTFFFNGGPGGATNGLRDELGPRTVVAAKTADGFAFADNPDSLIDASDLVFVDAPGTGYGRFFGEGASAEYWGVEEDARAITAFIADWLKAHGRTGAPVYLAGESYAGARVGFVADMMAKRPEGAIPLRGVVAISPVTSAGGPRGAGGRDPSVTALPSEAAVAWFHHRGAHTGETVEQVAESARRFADGPYAAALAKGDALDEAERARIAAELAGYTGLSEAAIRDAKLKIPANRFVLDLLADQGERIGLSDGRAHALRSVTDRNKPPYDDPSSSNFVLTWDPSKAAEASYRQAMGYRPMSPYVRLSYDANSHWDNKVARGPSSIPLMFKALMATNPKLRIFLMNGYFDLNVPYSRPLEDYLAADLPADRFSRHLYLAGHSVFADQAGRAAATDDLRAFYRAGK